jgi:ribonuclease HI
MDLKSASLKELYTLQSAISEEIARRDPVTSSSADVVTFTDGAARGNPGPGGAGVLLFDGSGKKILEDFLYLGECTNNEAEYRALLLALEHAAKKTKKNLDCFMDSELLVRQLTGVYQVKSEKLLAFYDEVKKRMAGFQRVRFTHVPREHPKLQLADKLANKAIDEENKMGGLYGR